MSIYEKTPAVPNRILQRVATPLLTSDQIRSLIGSEHSPCVVCGGCEFCVTHRGQWLCVDCDPSILTAPSGIALHLHLFHTGDGDRQVALPSEEFATLLRMRSVAQDRLGGLEAVGSVLWAFWRSTEGIVCYARLDLHDPQRLLAQIEAGETLPTW